MADDNKDDLLVYKRFGIAVYIRKSETTVKRWRRKIPGAFEVASYGCPFGKTLAARTSTLDNLIEIIEARTSQARRKAVLRRWRMR